MSEKNVGFAPDLLNAVGLSAYIGETVRQLHKVIIEIDAALGRLPQQPPGPAFIKADYVFHEHVEAALRAAGIVRRLVQQPAGQRKGEKDSRSYRVRVERSRRLTNILGAMDVSALFNVDVRDALEHIDELLDSLAIQTRPVPGKPGGLIVDGLIWGTEDTFKTEDPKATIKKLRVYVVSTMNYHALKHTVNLGALRSQAEKALGRFMPYAQG